MKVTYELTLANFQGWSGAQDTIEKIVRADLDSPRDLLAEAEMLIEEQFGGECTETELNDFLRFEDEYIFSQLGIADPENDPDEVDGDGYEEEDV